MPKLCPTQVHSSALQRTLAHFSDSGRRDPAFIKRFNRSFRDEVFDGYFFDSLDQVRELTDTWLEIHNTEQPHHCLGQVPPLSFLPRPDAPTESALEVAT